MKKVVGSQHALCVGCNRCVRACPIEMANLTYRDEAGDIKVRVDSDQCIACGACLAVCKHGARYYLDDTERFFADLAAGHPISLIAAPSLRTNFPEWPRLLTWLRGQGVRLIYDVSLGADICIWAHLRYLEREHPTSLVTQPCSALVSYGELHQHALLAHLSPIHSPMCCTAIYMKDYQDVPDRIAALSPCIAKSNEFEATGLIDYNITFAKLWAYMEANEVTLPTDASAFDHQRSGLGALFPTPGGFTENIEHHLGKRIRVDRMEGIEVYKGLDEYVAARPDERPMLFDVLSCKNGCNLGPGCRGDNSLFSIQARMNTTRETATDAQAQTAAREALSAYDRTLSLTRFLRGYTPVHTPYPSVTEDDIQRAFSALDKDTYAKQNFDCGACGCDTCRDMARRIAMGINIPDNCLVKSRDDAEREHRRNAEYIALIHHLGETLLSTKEHTHDEAVLSSLRALCTTFECGIASLWRVSPGDTGYQCRRMYAWPTDKAEHSPFLIHREWPRAWLDALSIGQPVSTDARQEPGLFSGTVSAVTVVPVLIKGVFWGFVAFANATTRTLTEGELSVVAAGSILIASSIIEREMTDSLIRAREDALAGTRAKSDFLSRMSHEMRTPMNAIIGMTKIASGSDDLDKLRYCLSTIDASSNHLLRLINDVLDMSKIEAGKFTLDNAPFDLEQTLINTCNLITEKVEEKGLCLRVSLGETTGLHYVGDALRLSQVLTNLLSNAVKFTPEGGCITIAVMETSRDDARSTLRFCVSDTGIGMTQEQIDRLFQAFEQADTSITSRFGGTGLGLAISRSIVEKMGGRIWATATPGAGSAFTFDVSLTRDMQAEGAAELPQVAGARILYADSDAQAREDFLTLAARLSLSVETATSGEEAIAHITASRDTPYDAVLLHHTLADMSGLDVVRALGDACDPNTVLLVSTFLVWQQLEAEAHAAGVRRLAHKPLFPTALANAIDAVLRHRDTAGDAGLDSDPAMPDLHGRRILLVEDIEINRMILMELLKETGALIEEAEDGMEAIARFEESPEGYYDLIFMDIQMPRLDGYDTTLRIRAMDRRDARRIPILAMTANAYREDVERALAAGMNGHLAKPIDLGEVFRALAEHLRQDKR